MPDLALGALIGIGGTIVGAIIGSLSSYIIARLQINARREELSQQLCHKEQEVQRDRLIGARKDTLISLRRTIGEWVACSQREVAMIVRLKKAVEEKSADLELELSECKKIVEQTQQLSLQRDMLRGQISDNTIDNLIEAVEEIEYEASIQRAPLLRLFNNPNSGDINALELAYQKDQELLKKIRNQLIQVNKRIEELLSGSLSD